MNERRVFDPNKARRVGGPDGVENVPFEEMGTQASIINSLNNLRELFKGADVNDFDTVFAQMPDPIIERYKNLADQVSMNLNRILDDKKKKS